MATSDFLGRLRVRVLERLWRREGRWAAASALPSPHLAPEPQTGAYAGRGPQLRIVDFPTPRSPHDE